MTTSPDTDPFSMQKLFQKDLETQLKPVLVVLESPQEGAFSEHAAALCQTLCQFSHAMRGPTLLMEYKTLVVLVELLGGLSQAWLQPTLLEHPSERFTQFYCIVSEVIKAFKKIVDIPPSMLAQTVQEMNSMLEGCLHALQTLPELEEKVENVKKIDKVDKVEGVEKVEPIQKVSLASSFIPTEIQKISQVQIQIPPHPDASILSLFFVDLETYTRLLQEGLLALEFDPSNEQTLASLMRAAHSIKGAARVIGLDAIVHLAHALEECLLHIQDKRLTVVPSVMDRLFAALDLFRELFIKQPDEVNQWLMQRKSHIVVCTQELMQLVSGEAISVKEEPPSSVTGVAREGREEREGTESRIRRERILRMKAATLNRLMGFAGELLVESRWLQPFSEQLLQLKKLQYQQSTLIDALRGSDTKSACGESEENMLTELQRKTQECRVNIADRLEELEGFMRRHRSLSDRLYREVVSSRLCSFDEGVEELPRIVRDLSQQLHKQVHLEMIGRSVTVDRDILDKLQIPLQHLLRNAIDHGIEMPAQRIALGKPATGTIRVEVYHRAGLLNMIVADDGNGVDLEALKRVIVEKKWVDATVAEQLTKEQLLHFLFAPGFTTSTQTTEISGRGFGLNTVQTMVHDVGGQIRVESIEGKGTRFCLQLPLTLSILRCLLVNIAGEPYAFPLARSARALMVESKSIKHVESRLYVQVNEQNVGLIWGSQLLGMPSSSLSQAQETLSIVLLKEQVQAYGIVVDSLIGEKELIVQELDPRLGKIPTISCGAFMEDGSPVLVIDVDDIMAVADRLLSSQEKTFNGSIMDLHTEQTRKCRILVVDDSITVREVESRILETAGYIVDVAINGAEAWNLVRMQAYDLIITDVDMPGMDGLELLRMIKASPSLKDIPVMIVSYKEHPEDRVLGMEAGAAEYLTKSSFHDHSFLEKVHELLMEASCNCS